MLAIPVYMQGDYDRAEQLYQEALEYFRAEGDRYWMAEVLLGVAHVALDRGDHERAAAAYEESLQLSQHIGSKPGAARAQSGLGFLARARGDPRLACRLFQESLAVWGEIDDATSIAICLEAMAGARSAASVCRSGRHNFLGQLRRCVSVSATRSHAAPSQRISRRSPASNRPCRCSSSPRRG